MSFLAYKKEVKVQLKKMKQGFMKDSMCILLIVCLIIVTAFIWNYKIIRKEYMEESVNQRKDLFAEVTLQLEGSEANIEKILTSAISNNAAIDYIQAESFGKRWDQLRNTQQFVTNLITLNDSILAVCIYDNENKIIGMHGSKYTEIPQEMLENDYKFSNQITIGTEIEHYFFAAVPLYEKNRIGVYEKAGEIALLMKSDMIQKTLDFAISGYHENTVYIAVEDREGNILVDAGNVGVLEEYRKEKRQKENYLYFEEKLTRSQWKLFFVTNKTSYMNYMNFVLNINIVTYICVFVAQALLCYMLYSRVMIPMKKQMNFVMNYTKDTSQRMKIGDKYEFGELEKEFNEMLDGIEELNQKIIEEKERYQKLEYEKKKTEILAYKNQINPHFLHNTLECIRGMALYKGEKEIAKLTEAMSRMFQYNIRGGEIVTVREMVRSLKNYAVIIEYRFMGKIEMKVKTDPETELYRIPKMLVQPLVENAVRHGVERKIEGGQVTVEIMKSAEGMKIMISDTGVGMDEEICERQQKKFKSPQELEWEDTQNKEIGVANVARRMHLFYQNTYQAKIESIVGKGTIITLILPEDISG